MLHITINQVQYQIPQGWDELTLERACQLNDIARKFPEKLLKFYEAHIREAGETDQQVEERTAKLQEDFTTEEMLKTYPDHFGKAIACLGEIPEKIMERVLPADRIVLYQQQAFAFVFGLLFNQPEYQIQQIAAFEFEGERYLLPESRMILDQEQPMANETALTFSETADLLVASHQMEEGKWTRAANIVAILCRKEGEAYDEKVSLERAERFKKLPMSVILEVFFCATAPSVISLQRDRISLLEQKNGRKKGRRLLN